uniref:non-specific serine/threonine protein kinase n=1 Tax=Chenopodium quinoa TaxID=63459 RepID=A0A803LP17_CHEQI
MYRLISCATALFCFLQFLSAANIETDRLALLEGKDKITDDPFSVMNSWNDSLHFCGWHGVTCGYQNKRVVELDLHSLKLRGSLSPYVGNLSFLKVLNLQNNSFGGTIPPEVGRLHNLQSLLLTNNSIAGEIPSNISRCSSLFELGASRNKLVGRIPPGFGFLLHLLCLDLSTNNLTGTIPSSLGNLSSLSMLHLGGNNLVEKIPDDLGNLKNLTILALGSNMLSGIVPLSIFNLSFLAKLDLGSNDLEGHLPSDLGNTLPYLQFLSIAGNQFTGLIPASISNSSNIGVLQMSENYLQGPVPSLQKLHWLTDLVIGDNSLGSGEATDLDFVSSLANATMLQWLDIGPNNFKGILPKIICNFSTLTFLKFESNRIAGKIPTCIESLVELQIFNGWGSQLSGVIPQGIGKLQNLNELDLSINQLSGDIPSSIGNLTKITVLQLSQNNLQGHIPLSLGNCRNLLGLALSQNNLSGRIPSSILSLSTLSIALDLSSNRLTGSLPEEIGQLNNLAALDISGNMLSGGIPTALQTLKGLRILDLSQNNLSGEIPKFLVSLPLQMLNLSDNVMLKGEVPTSGVFSNISAVFVTGNNRLCGGIAKLKLPRCNFVKSKTRRSSHRLRKKTKELATSDDLEDFPNMSYQFLLKATEGFSSNNLLGYGSFGVVYKGILNDQDGKIVAVKVFKLEHAGAFKSFMAECEVLRSMRHRNLIKIVTACSSVDYQGNDFKALVYEYMINGSLDDWLHPTQATNRIQDANHTPKSLNLCQRLDVAVDVAFALEYLHHSCVPSVVHCDLKPSNVLLDSDLVAHVSDFGLAKFLVLEDIDNSQQSSSVGLRGTIGYAPPEYGSGNEVSICGDVYSFGILLLEMFTGKRPTDDMFNDGLSLRHFVEAALPDKVSEILDNALLEEIAVEENNSTMILNALISVLRTALSCSTELPRERLNMSDVATKLSSIKGKLLQRR